MESLNRLGKYQEVIDFVNELPEGDFLQYATMLNRNLEPYIAYLNNGEPEKAIEWIQQMMNSQYNGAFLLSKAAYGWSCFYQDSTPNPFHQEVRKNLHEFASLWDLEDITYPQFSMEVGLFRIREYQYYILEEWEKAEEEFLNLRKMQIDERVIKFPAPLNNDKLAPFVEFYIEAMLGSIFARQGKKDLAYAQIEVLENMWNEMPAYISPPNRPKLPYYQARIYALLGEKEKAVEKLRLSENEGRYTNWWHFTMDWDLASLRGYKPYEELIRPGQ